MSKLPEITLGFEFEFYSRGQDFDKVVKSENLGIRTDSSIQDSNGNRAIDGVEIVTPAYFVNPPSADEIIANVSKFAALGNVNSSCGVHIHIGNPIKTDTGSYEMCSWNPQRLPKGTSYKSKWDEKHVLSWIIAGQYIEALGIYNCVPPSRSINQNCVKINQAYTNKCLNSNDPVGSVHTRKYKNCKRYCWINLIETKRKKDAKETRIGYAASEGLGTVEIRLMGEMPNSQVISTWTRIWVEVAYIILTTPPYRIVQAISTSSIPSYIESLSRYIKYDHPKCYETPVNFSHEFERED